MLATMKVSSRKIRGIGASCVKHLFEIWRTYLVINEKMNIISLNTEWYTVAFQCHSVYRVITQEWATLTRTNTYLVLVPPFKIQSPNTISNMDFFQKLVLFGECLYFISLWQSHLKSKVASQILEGLALVEVGGGGDNRNEETIETCWLGDSKD
jgi:hypothetical protein